MLSKRTVSAFVMIFALLVFTGSVWAKDLVIINGTSFGLHGMALSPSESNNWGNDFLANSVLKPGDGLTITISGDANNWDLAVVDDDGTQLEFKNLDLRKVKKVTLLSDGTANLE